MLNNKLLESNQGAVSHGFESDGDYRGQSGEVGPQESYVDESSATVREYYSEEACMDFIIYELGYRSGIPRDFRYAQGIDRVRTRLMLRYGDRNLDRAMGIFNEILECQSESGSGDESDVWRSWRYDHTHCRVSTLEIVPSRCQALTLPLG